MEVLLHEIPKTFEAAIHELAPAGQKINLAEARVQHDSFCRALKAFGINIRLLSCCAQFPDGVFARDPVLVFPSAARVLLLPMGHAERKEETRCWENSIAECLPEGWQVDKMPAEMSAEGGDFVPFHGGFFVGLSARTNEEAVSWFESYADRHLSGLEIVRVTVDASCLHLGTGATVWGRFVLINPGWIDEGPFSRRGLVPVRVAKGEEWGANIAMLGQTAGRRAGHKCIASKAFTNTNKKLRELGLDVCELSLSQFTAAQGGPSCLIVPLFTYW